MERDIQHAVTLSLLDQGMPRHYTRFCLGFRLGDTPVTEAVSRLEAFFRRTFQAQPWLAGYACPVRGDSTGPRNKLEIRFSQRDVEEFSVKIQELSEAQFPLTYDDFCELGMPPSRIPSDLISSCPDKRPDTEPALILDVTVNIIRGGLLVAIFLHHGVTDGASMGTIISGQLCRGISELSLLTAADLASKADTESQARLPLSFIPRNQPIGLHLEYKSALRALGRNPAPTPPPPPKSAVTSHIFLFSDHTLQTLKATLNALVQADPNPTIPWLTTHDALQSLLWHHLTRARIPSLHPATLPETSTFLIPVNIRRRITPPLPPTFLGGAVALAPATLPLSSLLLPQKPVPSDEAEEPRPKKVPPDHPNNEEGDNSEEDDEKAYGYLLPGATKINTTISQVTDSYLHEVLALTAQQPSVRDMVDINVNQVAGLDLVVTSWAVLPVFGKPEDGSPEGEVGGDGDVIGLGMGLGPPDYIRKPWSRDAGGCIILPRDGRRRSRGTTTTSAVKGERSTCAAGGGWEVLVQLKTVDMQRLLRDEGFMRCVERVID